MNRKHSEFVMTALITCLIIVVTIFGCLFLRTNPGIIYSPSLTPAKTNTPTATVTFTPSRTLTPTQTSMARPSCGSTYVVQWGDTLAKIAMSCGVTVSQLYAANPGSGNYIYVGQVITIPSYSSYPSWFHIVPAASETPNPTQIFQAVYEEIDKQFQNSMKANIAYNKPKSMKKGGIEEIELLLSPSLPPTALAKQILQHGDFVTSTAEPERIFSLSGEEVTIETSNIEITNRMNATLVSLDPEAFVVQELHKNADQVVSTVEPTKWHWAITAMKDGQQTLVLVLYRLVMYEGKDYWIEVETYRANIVVEVSTIDQIKSLDWKWILGIIVTMLLIPAFWRWFDYSRKKDQPEKKKRAVSRKRKTKK